MCVTYAFLHQDIKSLKNLKSLSLLGTLTNSGLSNSSKQNAVKGNFKMLNRR